MHVMFPQFYFFLFLVLHQTVVPPRVAQAPADLALLAAPAVAVQGLVLEGATDDAGKDREARVEVQAKV